MPHTLENTFTMIKHRKELIAGLILAIMLMTVQACFHARKAKCKCLHYEKVNATVITQNGEINTVQDSICTIYERNGSVVTLNLK